MAKKCECNCKKYETKSNAVCVVVYDLGGATLNPQAVAEIENVALKVALENRLAVTVTRN